MNNDWLPISTAPKDGTKILGIEGDFVATTSWSVDDDEWETAGDFWGPTHWKPMPPKPATPPTPAS